MNRMDPLRREALERARTTPPEEKARQAFDLAESGFRLKRASLRARHPAASEEEIEHLFREWLVSR